MTQTNYTINNRHFKHLSDIQGGKLEQLAKCGTYTQAEMACELGVSQSTVSRELRRGKTRYFLTKKVWGKSAALVQKGVLDLMKKQGLEQFKTLTTDNGSEFSTLTINKWG